MMNLSAFFLHEGRRSGALLLVLLLFAGGASAQVPATPSNLSPPAEQEPISPIPEPPAADPRKVALGEHLFDDPRLSRDGVVACSSCHDIRSNGASKHQFDRIPNGPELPFNAPTVFNAGLSFRLNWQGNIRTLEDQAEASLTDPRRMGVSLDTDISVLMHEEGINRQFEAAYGHGPDRKSLLDAIATYERTLLTPDSRFDRWLRGDADALSAEALSGYQLFKSFGCVSCHQGVNVGGNLFEQSGVFHKLASDQPLILRVPSLRNVAVTAPYFHDGSASNLTIAVRKMGYAQLNRTLSDEQIHAIVAFLDSLTGVYQGRTLATPP
jgi:cytochrome c peroxidase